VDSQSENESGSEAPTESADESGDELKEYTPVVTETKKIIKLN